MNPPSDSGGGSEHWVAKTCPPQGEATDLRRLTEREDIEPFLDDAAHYPGGFSPSVLLPGSEAAIASALVSGARILPTGAQSSLTGGATPHGETVVSLSRLSGMRMVGPDRVVAGAGLILSELCRELRERGAYYPPVPTYDGAAVGGTVSTNAAGAACFKYGMTRRWVEGLRVVLACGEVLELARGEVTASPGGYFEIERIGGQRIRVEVPRTRMADVAKQSAGYFSAEGMDLVDLFVGSEGTLGVVTEVTLRVVPERPECFTAWVPCGDDRTALELTDSLRRESLRTRQTSDPRGVDVAAIEYVDRRCLEILREDGGFDRVGLQLPAEAGAAILLQAELPAGTDAAMVYEELARLEDPAADSPVLRLNRLLMARGLLDETVAALPGEERKRNALFALREAVPECVNARIRRRQREVDGAITKVAADVVVPFGRLGEGLESWRQVLDGFGLDHATWGHASDGNVHPNILPRSGAEMPVAREALLAVGEAAMTLGGCPMSEHGTGRNPVKQELLRRFHGEEGMASMQRVKRALDPNGQLSPGVLWPGETATDGRKNTGG